MAIRDNRIAAESVGIPVTQLQDDGLCHLRCPWRARRARSSRMNYSTIAANKFDFNASILILVFVVLGGLGNMLRLGHRRGAAHGRCPRRCAALPITAC